MNRLKELREDRDLHQKDIAKVLEIDQSNYSKYELEKINIPLEYLNKLADFIILLQIIFSIEPMKENHTKNLS